MQEQKINRVSIGIVKKLEEERCTIFEIYAIIENVKHLFNVQSERDVNNQIDAIAQGKKLEEFD